MRYVALCGGLVLVVASALAQVGGTGSIQGTVTDASGAVLTSVAVTATNDATGVQITRATTSGGTFVLPLLPPGVYSVAVKAPGFQPSLRVTLW
jgi:hypothetical protein